MTATRTEDKHVALDSVKINGRFRKDLGDLEELKASIQAGGLLQPVVVTPDHTLVCGARRLEALRQLGWSSVPVTIKDNPTEAWRLEAERDENTCRLDMKPMEMHTLTRALLAIEPVVDRSAIARKAVAAREAKRHGITDTPRADDLSDRKGRRLERAAKAAGWSATTYRQANAIAERAEAGEAAAQEALGEMERTGKVKSAWRKLNGTPLPPKQPVKLDTQRQRNVAKARKNRVAKAIYGLEGTCTGLAEMDLRYVVAAASTEELDEWDRLLAEAAKTFSGFRRKLKTEREVA